MSTGRFMACVFASAMACGGADDVPAGNGSDDTTSTDDTTGTDAACLAGYEGCACAPGDVCLAGLACLSQLCVDAGLPAEESTTSGDTTSAEASGDTSTSSPVTAEESGETSSTTDASTTTGDGSSSEDSSTTAVEPECFEGDNYCLDGEVQTCVGGLWQYQTCVEHCAPLGYDSPGCANADGCTCNGFIDEPCENGSLGLCYCAEVDFAIPCTTEQWTEFYDECIAGVDYAVCFIDYPWTGDPAEIDCAAAEAACL